MLCQHCKNEPITRPRGLGKRCFADHTIRGRYATAHGKLGARHTGSAAANVALPLADEPTRELPGTAGKIMVMRRRAAAGRAVFHPGDAKARE